MRTSIKNLVKLAAETVIGEEPTSPSWARFNFLNDGDLDINEQLKDEKGVGGSIAYYAPYEVGLSLGGLLCAQDLELFANLFPAPDLTPKSFTVLCGNPDVGFGGKVVGAVVREITLEGKAGEALKFSVEFNGMFFVPQAVTESPTPPNKTGVLVWHHGIVTLAGGNYQISEFKLTHSQDLKLEADLSTPKPTGKKRARHLVAWGFPEITLSLKCYVPYNTDIAADLPAPVDVIIVVGNMTVSLNDLLVSKRKMPVQGGDDLWVMDLELKGYEGCLSINIAP